MRETNAAPHYEAKFSGDSDDEGALAGLSLSRAWVALIRRRWIVLAFLILGLAIGSILSFRARNYTADGLLRIEPSRSSMYQISASQALGGDSTLDEKLNTEVIVLGSDGLLLRVARDLDLANNPAFYAPALKQHQLLDTPATREAILLSLRKQLVLLHVPKTEIVKISATTHSGKLSANLINTLVNDYISDVLEVRFGSTQRVSQWLIGQLDELKTQVQKDQEQLVDLESRLGVLTVDPKSSTYLNGDALAALSRASSEATITRILAEARFRYLQESDPNLIETEQSLLGRDADANSLLKTLRSQLADALANYASLTSQFGANYPPVRDAKAKVDALTDQLSTEEKRIVNQSHLAYSAAAANETMTAAALQEQQKQAFRSRDDIVRFAILQREYESHRALYESLVQRLKEAGINSGLQSAEVDVVDLAAPPANPRLPSPAMWIIGATLGMIAVGCIAAIVIDLLDAKFDTVEDGERALGLVGLAMLPLESSSDQRMPFVSKTNPTSHFSEGIQIIRNAILLSNPDRQPKVFFVTSAWPQEGKSTVARELATTFAQHSSRVLLIDGDLRKPSQHNRIGLPRGPGLSNVLTGAVEFEEAIHHIENAGNLWVLTAGPTPPQAAVLWNSHRMRDLIERCRQDFDFIIIDSAPVLSVSDTALGVALADSVLLVVRHLTADQRSVQQAVRSLVQAGAGPKLAGFVLNAVDMRWSRYMPYYGKYTYGSYGTDDAEKGGQ